jgi:hypothetical protein
MSSPPADIIANAHSPRNLLICDMKSRREWCNHSNRMHPLLLAHNVPSMSDDSPRWIRWQEDISSSNFVLDLCGTLALSWTLDSQATITSAHIRRVPLTHMVDVLPAPRLIVGCSIASYQDNPPNLSCLTCASKRRYVPYGECYCLVECCCLDTTVYWLTHTSDLEFSSCWCASTTSGPISSFTSTSSTLHLCSCSTDFGPYPQAILPVVHGHLYYGTWQ